ncbi:hypothetical protein BH20ACT21_BH20ACT21_02480 [soil metagenome]
MEAPEAGGATSHVWGSTWDVSSEGFWGLCARRGCQSRTMARRKKPRLAGRSAKRLMRYGYHADP